MWCHWRPSDGPYFFLQRLTGDIYAKRFARWTASTLTDVPLQTRWQIYYQHDGAPPHFSQVVRQYLNHKFPNRWIGRGGAENCPPRSPDLNQITMCGVTWKLWCMYTSWTREKNYSSEFSALQEAPTTLQCFVRLQVLWSHESENAFKQTEDTSNNFFFLCWKANL